MGLDLEIVQIARQWQAIIKRAAITEGLDKVSNMLEQDELIEIAQSIEAPEVEEIVMEENIALQESQSILNTYNIETIPEFEPEILSASNLHMETTKVMEDIRATEDIKDTDSNNNRNKEVLENIKDLDSESYKDITLEESIWAPKKDRCEHRRDVIAKVAAINVTGDTTEHRIKSLRWLLRENVHIKDITEKFTKGNQWCIIIFDCEKGFEEVKTRLENPKEEHEKLKLIPEKTQKMSQKENSENKDKKIIKKEESKSEREKRAQRELEEIFEQRKRKSHQDNYKRVSTERRNSNASAQTNSEKEFNEDNNLIVVWDLLSWAKRTQIFESV